MSEQIEVRSRRVERRFFVDNVVIHSYGRVLGPIGISVYCTLCMYANVKTQVAWPSQTTIAEQIGSSAKSVGRALKVLEERNMIVREPRYRADGGRSSDLITLLELIFEDTPETESPAPLDTESATPRTEVPRNNPKKNNHQGTKRPEEHRAQETWEPESIIEIHYKNPAVTARGRVRDGPWAYECATCGTSVFFKVAGHTEECMSCGAMYILRLEKLQLPQLQRKAPSVEAYYLMGKGKGIRYDSLDPTMEAEIVERVDDLQFFKEVMMKWLEYRFNFSNVMGMLECYDERRLPRSRRKQADPAQAISDEQLLGPTVPYWELPDDDVDEVDSGALDPNMGTGIDIPGPKEDTDAGTESVGDTGGGEDKVADGEQVAADTGL